MEVKQLYIVIPHLILISPLSLPYPSLIPASFLSPPSLSPRFPQSQQQQQQQPQGGAGGGGGASNAPLLEDDAEDDLYN